MLYGLKQAGRSWNKTVQSKFEPYVFTVKYRKVIQKLLLSMWKCVANYVFLKKLIIRSRWYGHTNLLLKENILKIAVISVQHNNNTKADINSNNYQWV